VNEIQGSLIREKAVQPNRKKIKKGAGGAWGGEPRRGGGIGLIVFRIGKR